jgi:DNA-binding NtrC family response regulator
MDADSANRTASEALRVLLVDDDAAFRTAMSKALRRRGFDVTALAGGEDALAALRPGAEPAADVALLDLRLPDVDGLDVLRRTPGRRVPVVVLTGHGTVPDAVEAMRLGAFSFLMKPVDAEDLAPVLRQAAAPTGDEQRLAGTSAATARTRALLDRIADAEEPVLLTGETGTGKEVAARYLHARSRRAPFPFVAVNMASLPRDLVESELFGHARGAFTGAERRKPGLLEEAGEGTLFLDEIAELAPEHQAKLLRVIETRAFRSVGETAERPFMARLVAATHRNLPAEARAGRFRDDLYYRLQVLPIELPPLRARTEDVLPILGHWLALVGRPELALTEEAHAALVAHEWPGNVRELVNLARRLALFAEGDRVDAALVRRMLAANPFSTAAAPPPAIAAADGGGDEELSLEEVERRHIERLLARHRNITRVAQILGINRRTLQRKLKGWGIDHEDFGGLA